MIKSVEASLIPVSFSFAKTYVDNERKEKYAEKCVNLFYDPTRGEIICLDNGLVIAEHVPSLMAEDNRVWVTQKLISKKRQPKYIVTYGNIPEHVARKILVMYKNGKPVKYISEKLGVRIGAIYDVVKANTKTRRKHKKYQRITKKELQEIKEELESGASICYVARKHNRSTSYIHYLIKKYKIRYRPRKPGRKRKATTTTS